MQRVNQEREADFIFQSPKLNCELLSDCIFNIGNTTEAGARMEVFCQIKTRKPAYLLALFVFLCKILNMETLVVTPKSKQSIPFLKHLLSSLTDVASVEIRNEPKRAISKNIKSGIKEGKDILSGKLKGKTIKQLIDED